MEAPDYTTGSTGNNQLAKLIVMILVAVIVFTGIVGGVLIHRHYETKNKAVACKTDCKAPKKAATAPKGSSSTKSSTASSSTSTTPSTASSSTSSTSSSTKPTTSSATTATTPTTSPTGSSTLVNTGPFDEPAVAIVLGTIVLGTFGHALRRHLKVKA
jgi:cytoskeletal protein RodZ